jgi:hypothetical protein
MRPTPLTCFPRTMAKRREAVAEPPPNRFLLGEVTKGANAPGQVGTEQRTARGSGQGRRDDPRQARKATIRAGRGRGAEPAR